MYKSIYTNFLYELYSKNAHICNRRSPIPNSTSLSEYLVLTFWWDGFYSFPCLVLMTSEVMLVHCMCVCSTRSFSQLPVDFSHHKLTRSYSPLSTGQTQKEKERQKELLSWCKSCALEHFNLHCILHYLMMKQYLFLKPASKSLTIAGVRMRCCTIYILL